MKLVRLNSITDRLFDLRKNGNYPGQSTGFTKLNPYYTIRRGNTTYITGYPTSGKTQLYIQLMCNTSHLYGWKHLPFTPETGTSEEVYAEIIHCLTGKTFNGRFYNYITEAELYDVLPFVQDHFKIIDPTDGDCTLEAWYEVIREAKREFQVDTAGIDNWNDLEHDMSKHGQKISEYLKYQLPIFNRFAKTENIHGFLLVHPRNPEIMKGEKNPSAPRPDMIEGGSLWYAKAQSILIVHRDWSEPDNRTSEVIVAKAKPKIVGKKGMIELEYDPSMNCYFEEIDGTQIYPESIFKVNGRIKEPTYEQKKLQPGASEIGGGNDPLPF